MIWKSNVFCYIDNLNKMAWFKYKITDKVLALVYTFDTVLGWNQIKLFIQNIFIEKTWAVSGIAIVITACGLRVHPPP